MRSTRLVALALTLVVLAWTAAPGALAAPTRPTPERITVDAETGAVEPRSPRAATNVTVAVTGVQPSTGGFTLSGPGGDLFVNQSSRPDGVVEFWRMPIMPGIYNVTRDGETIVSAVLTTEEADHCASVYGYESHCQGSWGCRHYPREKVDEAEQWTPLVAVNSPSDGEAEVTQSWTSTESIYLAPHGYESTHTSELTIPAEDGEALGQFRLVKWGIYRVADHTCEPNQRDKTAKVISWEPGGRTVERVFDLTGDSRYTDADNVEDVGKADGRESLTFDLRYREDDGEQGTPGGPVSKTLSEEEIVAFGAQISVGPYIVTFDVVKFELAGGSETSYTYHFPEGGVWYYDELSASPGMAFCRPAQADC